MNDDEKDMGGVFIGTRQIYDQLLELTHVVKDLVTKMDRSTDVTEDHETRIRSVEKWKYATSTALLAALVSLAAEIVRTINH